VELRTAITEEHSRKLHMRFPHQKSRNKCSRLPPGCEKRRTGHYGGVGPSEREGPARSFSVRGAGNVGAPATRGSSAQALQVIHLDRLVLHLGT
jgi:hypothetical protein